MKNQSLVRRLPPMLLFALGLLLGSCSKKDTSPTIDFGPNQGFSPRTSSNMPSGTQDPTDWTVDGDWNTQEQALFSALPIAVNGAATGSFTGGAYPNPAVTVVAFNYTIPGTASCKFIVVDNKYRVILENTPSAAAAGQTYHLNLTNSAFQKGYLYRIYYLLYNGTTLYLKGHGDIKIAD